MSVAEKERKEALGKFFPLLCTACEYLLLTCPDQLQQVLDGNPCSGNGPPVRLDKDRLWLALTNRDDKEAFDVLEKLVRQWNQEEEPPKSGDDIKRYMTDHFSEHDFCMQSVADKFQLSLSHLSYLFKKRHGVTFQHYLSELRINRAKKLLANTFMKHYEIAYEVGFKDANHFTVFFKRHAGMTPSEFRREVLGL